jgi:hypothetical protein
MHKVSFFTTILNTSPKYTKDVSYFIDRIKSGASQKIVEEIRKSLNKEERNALKKQLPVICFNGQFINRSKIGLKKPSGLMILDFDDLDNAEEFKANIIKDKHVFSAFYSPSGGVKALYRIIDVSDDSQFKHVFEQVKERYPLLDDSGKDISRACFESYDPDIYVNLEADIFVPEVRILPHEDEIIGHVTNIPITDLDDVANRLVKWFSGKYDKQQRNNSLFKLAAAFNDFGVNKHTALMYCGRYAESGFGEKEIKQLVESAYKKTSQNGTKFFEDKTKKQRLQNMVLSGKKEHEIKAEFTDISDEKLTEEIKNIRQSIELDKFWEFDEKGKVVINPYKFKLYLESLNYYKYYPIGNGKAFVFITKDDNFLQDINEFQIKDEIMRNVLSKNEISVFNEIAENTRLFTPAYLSMIETADVELEKDGKDFAMLYFNNKAVKVFKDHYEIYDYDELEKHIWKNQVINRDFIQADHHESMFRSFLWLISGKEVERYNTMKSIIGYLLHSYKTSANNKAIILNDEVISDHPNGGSGKGLITNSIGLMKKVSTIDGKAFDFGKTFAYQTVPTDCQVLAFDDVKKNFDFEKLFSLITEGITIEYKNQGAIKLPVKDSPKVLISTNYTIKARGGSFTRRMFEVELSSYFGANHTPYDEFGCMLFEDWSEIEWARFDHFMINCLQYYLENGLVQYELKNLKIRKLRNNTAPEFVQFMDDKEFSNGQRVFYKEWHADFVKENDDFTWLKQRTFNEWLKLYFDDKGVKMADKASNGKRFYELTGDLLTENKADGSDSLPF